MERDKACHDVATSVNWFNFILIDVGHHLKVGRASRSGHASLIARGLAGLGGPVMLPIGVASYLM